MEGCPCQDIVKMGRRFNPGSSLLNEKESAKPLDVEKASEKPSGSNSMSKEQALAWHTFSSDDSNLNVLSHPRYDYGNKLYMLSNKARIEELGLGIGAVALRILLPSSYDMQQSMGIAPAVSVRGAGGTMVAFNNVDMKMHTPVGINSTLPQVNLLSGSDVVWNEFIRSTTKKRGSVIFTETGAEDMLRIPVHLEDEAWKVKTGHVLATTSRVKFYPEWCHPLQEADIETGFM